jgi:phage terminase small subunit
VGAPPAKPADLTGEAGAFWDRIVGVLAGVVRERDGEQLAELCRWWARIQRTGAALDKAQPGSLRYGRLMNQASTAAATFDRIAKRFGLTPADRAALHAEGSAVSAKPKVAVKPTTALDRAGPPKGKK